MPASNEVINLRIPAAQKALIDCAAQAVGKTRTTFILEQAVRHAEEVLADETRFRLSPEQWARFQEILDAPAAAAPALSRLLATPAPWDEESQECPARARPAVLRQICVYPLACQRVYPDAAPHPRAGKSQIKKLMPAYDLSGASLDDKSGQTARVVCHRDYRQPHAHCPKYGLKTP